MMPIDRKLKAHTWQEESTSENKCSFSHLIRLALALTGSIFVLEFIYRLPYLLIGSSHIGNIFAL